MALIDPLGADAVKNGGGSNGSSGGSSGGTGSGGTTFDPDYGKATSPDPDLNIGSSGSSGSSVMSKIGGAITDASSFIADKVQSGANYLVKSLDKQAANTSSSIIAKNSSSSNQRTWLDDYYKEALESKDKTILLAVELPKNAYNPNYITQHYSPGDHNSNGNNSNHTFDELFELWDGIKDMASQYVDGKLNSIFEDYVEGKLEKQLPKSFQKVIMKVNKAGDVIEIIKIYEHSQLRIDLNRRMENSTKDKGVDLLTLSA